MNARMMHLAQIGRMSGSSPGFQFLPEHGQVVFPPAVVVGGNRTPPAAIVL